MTTATTTPKPKKPPAKKPAEPKVRTDIPMGLGVMVRDKVTGLTGIVAHKAEMLTGNIQWAIQPRGNGESVPDAMMIDYHLLEVLGEGVSKLLPPIDDTVTVRLGEEVEDILTGLKGVPIDKITFQNGCVYFWVQPKMDKKTGKIPESKLVPHGRLKTVGAGLSKPEPKPPAAAAPPAKRPPGGPMRRAPTMRD